MGNTGFSNTLPAKMQFVYVNSDGVMGKTRSAALMGLRGDVIAICETNLASQHFPLVRHSFPGYDVFWGSPIHTQKGGVGFLVRNGSAWHTTPLTFPHGSACHRLFQSGRLHGITLWLGNGSYRFNCYVLCGQCWLSLEQFTA